MKLRKKTIHTTSLQRKEEDTKDCGHLDRYRLSWVPDHSTKHERFGGSTMDKYIADFKFDSDPDRSLVWWSRILRRGSWCWWTTWAWISGTWRIVVDAGESGTWKDRLCGTRKRSRTTSAWWTSCSESWTCRTLAQHSSTEVVWRSCWTWWSWDSRARNMQPHRLQSCEEHRDGLSEPNQFQTLWRIFWGCSGADETCVDDGRGYDGQTASLLLCSISQAIRSHNDEEFTAPLQSATTAERWVLFPLLNIGLVKKVERSRMRRSWTNPTITKFTSILCRAQVDEWLWLTSQFCVDLVCEQNTLTRVFFSHICTLILCAHAPAWLKCRTTCRKKKRCSCTCHHMSERLLFHCLVFFLCLSCLYFFSHFYLFSVLNFNFQVVETAEHWTQCAPAEWGVLPRGDTQPPHRLWAQPDRQPARQLRLLRNWCSDLPEWIRRHKHGTYVFVWCGTRRWAYWKSVIFTTVHSGARRTSEPETNLSLSWRKCVTSSVIFSSEQVRRDPYTNQGKNCRKVTC